MAYINGNEVLDAIFARDTGNIADGAVTTPKLADGAVTMPKLANDIADALPIIIGTGKNLFNPNDEDVISGKILDASGDPTVTNNSYMTTGYIEVAEGQIYFASIERNGTRTKNMRAYAFYDENKVFVSGSATNVASASVTIPQGVKYVRYSTYSDSYGGSDRQFEANFITDYEPYHLIYKISDKVYVPYSQNDALIKTSASLNWLNPAELQTGYVYTIAGVLNANSAYTSTKPVYVKGCDKLVIQNTNDTLFPVVTVFFNENMTLVAGYSTSNSNYPATTFSTVMLDGASVCVIDIPDGAAYFAISVSNAKATNLMAYALKGENVKPLPTAKQDYVEAYRHKQEILPEKRFIKSFFNGKKAVAIGDSITYGYPMNLDKEIPWFTQVASMLNMTYVNYGISASEIAQFESGNNQYNPMCLRYADMDNDADLIIVAGGTNDWSHSHTTLGTMGDTSINTFYGALDTMCKGLLAKYAGKQILFMTPIKRDRGDGTETGKEYFSPNTMGYTLKQFVDAIKEVCEFYGIPVLDMYANCSLNPIIPVIRNNYFSNDGSHPNFAGHRIMARQVAAYITTLVKDINYN